MKRIFFVAVLLPLIIDGINCYLGVRRKWKKNGASGILVIPLFVYALVLFNVKNISLTYKLLAFLLSTVLHILLAVIIPYMVNRKNT